MTGHRHALIVATDSYEDNGLERLLSPGEDAIALASVLSDPEIGGFGVEVVRNEPAHVVSRRVDDFFCDRGRNDSLLLHFSCHGLKNASGELFFAAADTVPHRLSSTAVSADFVRRCMADGRARNAVLFLDCCYGGAFMEGMGTRAAGDVNVFDSFTGEGFDSGRGWAVITASSAIEYAFEGRDLTEDRRVRPSVFTHALATGLASGQADLDADGRVSINELYDYVYDQVRQVNPHQTPSRSVHLQGDVFLARSKRRRTDPEGLPEELRSAVASPEVFSRRGAVPELRDRLRSVEMEIAEAACHALWGLVRNDIRSVADEAARALDEAAVRPSPEVLDFGRLGQYAPEPHKWVQLLGPVLARDCFPVPEADWIRVKTEPDALDVSVDTARLGWWDGKLTLRGRACGSAVRVRVQVVPQVARPVPARAAVADRPTVVSQPPGPPPAAASEVRIARFGERLPARVIDYVLVFVFALMAVFAVVVVMAILGASDRSGEAMGEIVAVLLFVGWGPLLFLYDWLFLRYCGATLGKMFGGLRVVNAKNGGRLTQGQALGRAALFGLPQSVPLLGHTFAFVESLPLQADPRGQALHDRAAGTVVVRRRT